MILKKLKKLLLAMLSPFPPLKSLRCHTCMHLKEYCVLTLCLNSPSTLTEMIAHLQNELKPEIYEFQVYSDDLLNDVIQATKRASVDLAKRV